MKYSTITSGVQGFGVMLFLGTLYLPLLWFSRYLLTLPIYSGDVLSFTQLLFTVITIMSVWWISVLVITYFLIRGWIR